MGIKSQKKNNTVVMLVGCIIVLIALMIPYPLYTSVPEQCPAEIIGTFEESSWCSDAHNEWVWQPPLIQQIYGMIGEKRNAPPGPPGSSPGGMAAPSYY